MLIKKIDLFFFLSLRGRYFPMLCFIMAFTQEEANGLLTEDQEEYLGNPRRPYELLTDKHTHKYKGCYIRGCTDFFCHLMRAKRFVNFQILIIPNIFANVFGINITRNMKCRCKHI